MARFCTLLEDSLVDSIGRRHTAGEHLEEHNLGLFSASKRCSSGCSKMLAVASCRVSIVSAVQSGSSKAEDVPLGIPDLSTQSLSLSEDLGERQGRTDSFHVSGGM